MGFTPEQQTEVDRLVSRALREQADSLALEGLKTELGKMWRAISEANHFKRDFGENFKELNALVRAHIESPMHAAMAEQWQEIIHAHEQGRELIKEFGVEALGQNERHVLPEVLRQFANKNDSKLQGKTTQLARERLIRTAYEATGALLALASLAVIGLELFGKIHIRIT